MLRIVVGILLTTIVTAPASLAGIIVPLTDPSGLAAEAEFDLLNPTTLQVRLRNTSTGVPGGFDSADQLLTSVSWDFGAPGQNPGDPTITGGTVLIGPASQSVNFDTGSYGPGADVSGEYGYGNAGTTGLFPNFISANTAGATQFPGANLDGPAGLDGPQAGLVADPILVPLGGLGAIQDEIIATLTLSQAVANLDFLSNGVIVEFGSDAAFIPEPGALSALAAGLALVVRRRRSPAGMRG